MAYLERELSVDGGHLGGHVHRGRGVGYEVLYRLGSIPLATGHEIEDELRHGYFLGINGINLVLLLCFMSESA